MLCVLDSNEFIFAYGHERQTSCVALLGEIAAHPDKYELRVSRTIITEVRRNVASRNFGNFWDLLETLGVDIDEDWEIPFELGAKYEAMGLKGGDAFISAYAEWTGADYLITENRDFLNLIRLPFKVLRAERFLSHHAR